MAAVIRVKRRVDEEPHNALVLSCKKRKIDATETEASDQQTTILKFAGTVDDDADIGTHIAKLSKDDAKLLASKVRHPNITDRSRTETRQQSHENRFKVVNCYRAMDASDSASVSGSGSKEITVVNIEKESPEQPVDGDANQLHPTAVTPSENDSTFVYDLYMTDNHSDVQMEDDFMNRLISVEPIESTLFYEDYRGQTIDDSDGSDSDDSNDENNWRNEYPEEDGDYGNDKSSVGDEDMCRAVMNLEIDDDLSSDSSAAIPFVLTDCGKEDEYDDDYLRKYFNKKGRNPDLRTFSDDDSDDDDSDDDEYYDSRDENDYDGGLNNYVDSD